MKSRISLNNSIDFSQFATKEEYKAWEATQKKTREYGNKVKAEIRRKLSDKVESMKLEKELGYSYE